MTTLLIIDSAWDISELLVSHDEELSYHLHTLNHTIHRNWETDHLIMLQKEWGPYIAFSIN